MLGKKKEKQRILLQEKREVLRKGFHQKGRRGLGQPGRPKNLKKREYNHIRRKLLRGLKTGCRLLERGEKGDTEIGPPNVKTLYPVTRTQGRAYLGKTPRGKRRKT